MVKSEWNWMTVLKMNDGVLEKGVVVVVPIAAGGVVWPFGEPRGHRGQHFLIDPR